MQSFFSKLFFGVSLLATANVWADAGICIYGHETLDSITCAGVATLDGTTVKNTVHVMGPLFAKNSTLNILDVEGVATLENTKVQGDVKISGTLLAKNSIFTGPMLLHSDEVTLNGSSISGPITMISKLFTANFYERSNSQINSITFQGRPGVVTVDPSSKVNGQVMNGTIRQG